MHVSEIGERHLYENATQKFVTSAAVFFHVTVPARPGRQHYPLQAQAYWFTSVFMLTLSPSHAQRCPSALLH